MSTKTHERSIHIDAPVEKVFDFIVDPTNAFGVIDEYHGSRLTGHMKGALTDVTLAPDGGLGSTWSMESKLFVFHVHGTFTRTEFVPNQRIVDHNADDDTTWSFTFDPDETGTNLTMAFSFSTKLPLVEKVADPIYWDGDRDLDAWLGILKQTIET